MPWAYKSYRILVGFAVEHDSDSWRVCLCSELLAMMSSLAPSCGVHLSAAEKKKKKRERGEYHALIPDLTNWSRQRVGLSEVWWRLLGFLAVRGPRKCSKFIDSWAGKARGGTRTAAGPHRRRSIRLFAGPAAWLHVRLVLFFLGSLARSEQAQIA